MGVYIKGMEMPTRCAECRLSTVHSFNDRPLCDVLVEYMSYGEWEAKRLDNCPLVEIPPHGALIDWAELWVEINKICDRRDAGIITDLACLQQILSAARHAPTILPAEPAEEGE